MSYKFSRRKFLRGLAVTAGGAALAACVPVTQPPQAEPTAAPEAGAAATPPPVEKAVLRVWGGNHDINITTVFFDRYAADHENVEFELVPQDELSKVTRLGLQSDSLDILLNNPGWAEQDPLVRAGLLRDIEDYWAEYNWDDRFTDYGKTNISYQGKVYGVPNEVSFIAYIYNAEIFRKHGLTGEEDPQTYDEFLEILQVLKDGGEAPIISGLRGSGSQSDHIYAPFVQAAVGRKGMEKLIFGDGKWTDPPIVEATHRMLDLAKDGYLDLSGLALDYTEAIGRFNEGKNPIWTGGVWANAGITEALGGTDKFSFFTVPPWDESIPLGYPGGVGSVYSIAASSAHADIAAEVFDLMFGEEGLRMWVEDLQTFPPVKADFSKYKLTPQQIKQTQVTQQPDGVGYWLVVYFPPEMLDLFKQGPGGVLGEQVTPEDWLEEMQKGWEKGLEEGTIPR